MKPRTGTICVFPHGAAKGSLLHEVCKNSFQCTVNNTDAMHYNCVCQGSGVLSGAKYVIRTEVLYEVDKSERIDASKD